MNSAPTANFDGAPKIAFVETEVFYGELLQGEVVERDILIRNDGDADLKIWRANPSCGCTVIVDVPEMIPPGEIATVRIEIDSKKVKAGSTRKGVTFESNDPQQPQLRFIFSMNIINLFRHRSKTDPVGRIAVGLKDPASKIDCRDGSGF